jgi:tetratricopeptide (TPR) repeat protein
MKSRWIILFFSLVVLPVAAQIGGGGRSRCTIRVDVLSAAGGHAQGRLRVQLLQVPNNFPVAMDFTNSSGAAEFDDLAPGQYRAKVSGDGIQNAESEVVEVNDWNVFMSATVVVQSATAGPTGGGAVVAAVDLNVPDKAIKEYDRGNEEMAKKHWSKAIDHFNRAIQIYPKYSAAYNNLGAAYGGQGQRDRQRQALQKAISANDHCVPALINLAHLEMGDKQITEARSLLNKAVAADPTNVEALSLLAEVEVQQGQYQQAIEETQKVHALPHQHFAIVHYTAASAYEREGLIQNAIAELHVYLQEDPQGSRADLVRKVLPAMEKEAKEAQNRSQ